MIGRIEHETRRQRIAKAAFANYELAGARLKQVFEIEPGKNLFTHAKVCGNCKNRRLPTEEEKAQCADGMSVCNFTGGAVGDDWKCFID